jgi:hypothetical protein
MIAKKWAEVTPGRAAQYSFGVQNPKADWKVNTVAAKPAWEAGIQQAISAGLFVKGVTRAGNAAWQRGAVEKGAARFGPGVALAQEAYQVGFAPYQQAIAALKLPPRGARRDPQNMLRAKAVVDAMIAVKQRITGPG